MNGQRDDPALGARAGHRAILCFCFVATLLEGFDIQAMGIAGPKMMPALGLAPGDAGLLFSASLFGMIPGALGGGWLADRLYYARVLPAALAIFGVFTLLTPAIADYSLLIAVRIMAGLGLGAAMPSIIAVAADGIAPGRRAGLVTLISSGLPLGAALAALTGRLALPTDWRIVFWLGGAMPILLAVVAVRLLDKERPLADSEDVQRGPANPLGVGWRLVALLLCTSYFFTLMALLLLMNWLPLLLAGQGVAAGAAGLLVLGFNLGGTIGGLALGRASERWGPLRPTAATFALLVVLLVMLGTARFPLPTLALALGCTGFLLMGGQCVLYGIGAAIYPSAMRARGVGLAVSAGRIGAMIGPSLAGMLVAARLGLDSVMLVTAVIVAVAGAAAASVGMVRLAAPQVQRKWSVL